jgi:hypothetical protein
MVSYLGMLSDRLERPWIARSPLRTLHPLQSDSARCPVTEGTCNDNSTLLDPSWTYRIPGMERVGVKCNLRESLVTIQYSAPSETGGVVIGVAMRSKCIPRMVSPSSHRSSVAVAAEQIMSCPNLHSSLPASLLCSRMYEASHETDKERPIFSGRCAKSSHVPA